MNGDIEGTDDCGCEPWHETGIMTGARFPWEDETGYACIAHCDCAPGLAFRYDDDAAVALSALTGRAVQLVDCGARSHFVLCNVDGSPMTTAQGDAFKAAWRAAHPATNPPPRDPNACADPACERCPRIARGETCSPDCAGWVLDQRGRVEPCDACGLYVDEQAAAEADAFLVAHCPGTRVYLCETLDQHGSFYAVLADDSTDTPWTDDEARRIACDAVRREGFIVASG